MDVSKDLKKSGVARKRAKAVWDHFEKEWEAENQPGPSTVSEVQDATVHHLQAAMALEEVEEPDAFVEPEETDYLEIDDDWHEDASEDEDANEDAASSPENEEYANRLRMWALSHKITHSALNDLLHITRETTSISLPLSAKTLLKTPVRVEQQISTVGGGQLWYQGIESALRHFYRSVTPPQVIFRINISVDGLPLHNSGPTQFWPILMQVTNLPEVPIMVLGIFCGSAKPDNIEEFLRPLVDEINHILVQGILINNEVFDFRLGAFVADSPARAFIKGVQYHTGIHGCIKCKIIGTYDKLGKKTIFEGTADDRTDEEFRKGVYTEHRKYYTPLLDLSELDIVLDIIVGDRLHLIDLGIMKRLLKGYLDGSLNPFPKWSIRETIEISNLLTSIKYPTEIHRRPRALKYVGFWKGSELAAFLHHCSIPLLKNRISIEAFQHFKLFYVAINLLSSKTFQQHWDYAEQLLKQFVLGFSSIYSRSYLTSNVHNLLHISAECQRFGPLPSISSYPFENKLQFIKNLVRTGHRTLNQVVCRLTELRELEAADAQRKQPARYPSLKVKKEEVMLIIKPNFILKKECRNAWFLTQDYEIVKYSKAIESSGSFLIEGHPMIEKHPTFTDPISSDVIYNFTAKKEHLSEGLILLDLKHIKCKLTAITLDQENTFYFSPLLHTLSE